MITDRLNLETSKLNPRRYIKRDYPYLYARVSAKKAKLLDEQDYESLWKMQPNGIARKIGEEDYKKEIDQLGSEYDGIQLVELALMKNLSRTMSHLVEISPKTIQPVIKTYLRRYDIQSLKRLLRWKKGGEKREIESFLTPVGDYTEEEFRELSEKTFEEIIKSIEFPESNIDYQEHVEKCENIKKIERDLDRAYYKDLEGVKGRTGSIWFDKFINREIKYANLEIILRLKKHNLNEEEIKEWLITEQVTKDLQKILKAETVEEALEIIEEEIDEEAMRNGKTVEEVEHALEKQRLRRALRDVHIEPLTATSIMGYIVAKVTEVKNLRMLIRAKETGIQNEETIKKNLVIA